MASNPLYNTNDSPNNSTQPTKAVNRQGVFIPRTHNDFDNSYFHFKSQKFGQYEPFFVMEGVPRDVISLHSKHEVRALPMSSPFLSSLSLNKDYFLVPNQAIQPNTWEYCYTHPSQGDDVPADAQNIIDLWNVDTSFIYRAIATLQDTKADVHKYFYTLMILELFFSSGSLLYNLGYKLCPQFLLNTETKYISFDSMFEKVLTGMQFTLSIDSDNFSGHFTDDDIDLYTCLSLIRRYGSDASLSIRSLPNKTALLNFKGLPASAYVSDYDTIRMDRICAYQLSCAQYYVNPQVDFIYNAQLYRDNFFTLLSTFIYDVYDTNLPIDFFSRNGIQVPYDYFSLHNYNSMCVAIRDMFDNNSSTHVFRSALDVLSYLFGYRESLRFGDYFTDCRTRPLAIGDNNVEVNQDGVDVVDMSRKIIYQRFRNAVIKLGNNFGDYLRGILGSDPSPDYHIPKFISHQDFLIQGIEVANTTLEQQGNIVTNLKTTDDHFAFEVSVDMPCVIIGMSYFSVPRVYSQTKDRQFFHKDREDMFNPMLQYFGDQTVFNDERTNLITTDTVFGYQSRYAEYKQRFSVASGAFVEYLPAWSFITDSIFDPISDLTIPNVQSPDFIRAHDYEFNRFFKAMNGVGLAKGYHFIVVYNNQCPTMRPMEINPSTL